MTPQVDLPDELPTIEEHVLVLGTEKMWSEFVREVIKDNEVYTYHISRMKLCIYDDYKTTYHFLSSSFGDEEIVRHLRGKEFHRWYNLGSYLSEEVRCHIRSRIRLK
jgi:hypothetical protein